MSEKDINWEKSVNENYHVNKINYIINNIKTSKFILKNFDNEALNLDQKKFDCKATVLHHNEDVQNKQSTTAIITSRNQ